MRRLRIVIDTNVLISAALKPAGLEAQVMELLAYGAFELFVSSQILDEYRGVFSRPKFARLDPARIAHMISLVKGQATVVTSSQRVAISEHEADNRFYKCADAAEADYIVTGNTRHFKKAYKATKIVNARQL